MPTYDFKCEACGHEMEFFKKLDEKAPNCPLLVLF
jgi:putative FmdB family regulatory protein